LNANAIRLNAGLHPHNHKPSGLQDTYQDTTSFVSTYTLFDRHLLAGFSPQSVPEGEDGTSPV